MPWAMEAAEPASNGVVASPTQKGGWAGHGLRLAASPLPAQDAAAGLTTHHLIWALLI